MLEKPKETPKDEPKKTKAKIHRAKKYDDLPEIPDYERPELEKYEKTDIDVEKPQKLQDQLPNKGYNAKVDGASDNGNPLPKVS